MQLVLNEMSVSEDPQKDETAEETFNTFLLTYSKLINRYHNISRSILSSVDINSLYIAPNYCVAQWRNSKIDIELKRRFLGMCQHIQRVEPSEDELICETEFGKFGGGIQLAAENVAPLISFSFSDEWKEPKIPCRIYRMAYDDFLNGDFLYNFSTEGTISDNSEWLRSEFEKYIEDIKTPSQLMEKLPEAFPSLHFIENATNQIACDVTTVTVPIIAERLFQLEKYFSAWDGEIFQPEIFPPRTISPESKKTLKDYKKEHTFLYDGQEILVSYHMRYTGGNIPGRIYFYPDHVTKKCVICSLTTKLPTVTEPKSKVR